jgi:hypothetical protein
MKKTVLAAVMALATIGASAQSLTVDGQYFEPTSGSDQRQIGLTYRTAINPVFTADGTVQFSQEGSGTYKTTGRAELGLSARKQFLGPFDGYARLAIGEKAASGADSVSYHSQEVGAIWNTPVKGLSARAGYRWRDSFADNKGDTSETRRYALSYDLNKQDTVGVRYDDVYKGNGQGKATALFFTRKF